MALATDIGYNSNIFIMYESIKYVFYFTAHGEGLQMKPQTEDYKTSQQICRLALKIKCIFWDHYFKHMHATWTFQV